MFDLKQLSELIVHLRKSERILRDLEQERDHYARRIADLTGILGPEVPPELSDFQNRKISAFTTQFEQAYPEYFPRKPVLVK